MVSKANRKLAETEEELRVVMEQKEALKGALRIVEGENGQLRGRSAQASPSLPARASHSESVGSARHRERRTPSPDRSPSPPATTGGSVSTGAATPPPPEQQSPGQSASVPAPVAGGGPNSFLSPITPFIDSPSPTPPSMGTPLATSMPVSSTSTLTSSARHRWSIMPKTPRSRSDARNEFEEAIQRMQDLVGEDAVPASGASPPEPEAVLPPIDFARKLSGTEMEDEVTLRQPNPWTL